MVAFILIAGILISFYNVTGISNLLNFKGVFCLVNKKDNKEYSQSRAEKKKIQKMQ